MPTPRNRHGRYWVYMVQASDETYYAGSTNNLDGRLRLHNAGNGAKYLRGKGPVELVYAKAYRYYKRALNAERQLKKLTRKEKEELIRNYARNHVGPADSTPFGREIKDAGPSISLEARHE